MSRSLASVLRRLIAFGADYCIIAVYLVVLILIGAWLAPTEMVRSLFASPAAGQASGFVIVTLPVLLYFTLMESSTLRGTLGKRTLGLVVVTVENTRLTRSRALGRSALKFLPWELSHGCLWRIPGWPAAPQEPPWGVYVGFAVVWGLVLAYILSAVISKRGQTLYDKLSQCIVIRGIGSRTP
jgi:uncharacterized RDD family membrane protein YckC